MKKLLIVSDMQNGILNTLPEKRVNSVVASIAATIQVWCNDILYTIDASDPHIDERFCTPIDLLYNEKYDTILRKRNTIGSYRLIWHLREEQYNDILIVGAETNRAIVTTALMIKCALPKATVRVDISKCIGSSQKEEESTVDILKSCGVIVEGEKIKCQT